jgi:TonB family protein
LTAIRCPSKLLGFALMVALTLLPRLTTPELGAQSIQSEQPAEKNQRKTLYRVEPEYPTDLKNMGIGGYVRVEATISPSGLVVAATVTGGNPILAEAAIKAVKKWKYAPQESQTKAQLVFHFSP